MEAPRLTLGTGVAVLLAGGGLLGLAVVLHSTTPKPPSSPGGTKCQPGQVSIDLITHGGGSVSGVGQSTRDTVRVCPQKGETDYYWANADLGNKFRNWQGPGGLTSGDNPIYITANDDGYLAATFDPWL